MKHSLLLIFLFFFLISKAQEYHVGNYNNGQIKEVGEFDRQKKTGHWKFYFEDGTLKTEGDYHKGIKKGEWKFYHSNGQLASSGNYTNEGVQYSYWNYFYANGQLKEHGHYNSGGKIELWESFYENGSLKEKANYSLYNQVHGAYIYKYENGVTKAIGKLNKVGDRVGEWVFKHKNGQLKTKGKYEAYIDKRKRSRSDRKGIWLYYYPNGQLKYKIDYSEIPKDYSHLFGLENKNIYYENGNFVAEAININADSTKIKTYYSNGKLKSIGHKIKGFKHGIWQYYNELGDLSKEITFYGNAIKDKNGERVLPKMNVDHYSFGYDEPYKWPYSPESFEKINIKSVKEVHEDEMYSYHKNGSLIGVYRQDNDGEFTIPVKAFGLDGTVIMENGTGVYNDYYGNGKLRNTITYINGCRNGKATFFYPNGNIRTSAIYKLNEAICPMGLRWEVLESFDPEGTEIFKGNLKNGNGSWVFYDAFEYDYGKIITNNYVNGKQSN